MGLMNLFGWLATSGEEKPVVFARDAKVSEMGWFDRVMTRLCEKLGLIEKQQE